MNKKNTKKTFKPAYVIDMTKCETANDLRIEIALSKHNAGLAMTDDDLSAIIEYVAEATIDAMPSSICICNCEVKPKKLPWYKRFWKRLKYAFTW